jgi:hypothetical protein
MASSLRSVFHSLSLRVLWLPLALLVCSFWSRGSALGFGCRHCAHREHSAFANRHVNAPLLRRHRHTPTPRARTPDEQEHNWSAPFNVILTHVNADFDSLAAAVGMAAIWESEIQGQRCVSVRADVCQTDCAAQIVCCASSRRTPECAALPLYVTCVRIAITAPATHLLRTHDVKGYASECVCTWY